MEVMLDRISTSSFGAASLSVPAMDVWIEVIKPSYIEGASYGGDIRTIVSGVVAGETSKELVGKRVE